MLTINGVRYEICYCYKIPTSATKMAHGWMLDEEKCIAYKLWN